MMSSGDVGRTLIVCHRFNCDVRTRRSTAAWWRDLDASYSARSYASRFSHVIGCSSYPCISPHSFLTKTTDSSDKSGRKEM
jgi:hypothetical protein